VRARFPCGAGRVNDLHERAVHGLDFRKLQGGPALFDFGSFFFALFVAVGWAFVFGALFGWIVDRLRPAA
jgi:hypothetical protein